MKSLILAATLIASTAFAGTTYVSYPKYDGVDVNNLCDAGNSFHTINPVSVCDSWTEIPEKGDYDYPGSWVCNSSHMEHATVSKTGTDCVKYGNSEVNAGTCLEHGTVQRSNTVTAERITSYGETEQVEYFNYTIPACH